MKTHMRKPNFVDKVLETIEKEKISPITKRHFLMRECSIWGVALVSLVVGSLAFAVVLYMIINNDWDVYENINDSLIEFIILSLPYFWLLLVSLFIITVEYYLKHTKKGYRYQIHTIIFVSVAGSVVLGTLFYNIGLGRAIDTVLVFV